MHCFRCVKRIQTIQAFRVKFVSLTVSGSEPEGLLEVSQSMTDYFQNYSNAFLGLLESVVVTDQGGQELDRNAAFERLCALSGKVAEKNGTQFFCGNGASAAFSNHMAIDWSKNGRVSTRSFSDSSLLTAIANDMGADEMFAAPLSFYGRAGDLLTTISSSGNSPNILKVIGRGRELSLGIVTFSGLKEDNASRKLGDLNFYVPGKTYGMVECVHQVLLHLWLDRYMGITEWDRTIVQNMRQEAYQL